MQEIIEKTYNFAKEYHKNENSGHDFEHIQRVYANTKKLLETEPKADAFIIKMSALLHDVDDRKLETDGKNTLRFLEKLGLDKNRTNTILKTIDAISFSKSGGNPNFETLEMAILSDADKLDAIGAIGLCRAIIFGASKNRPLFKNTVFPIKNISKEQYLKERKEDTAINHFFDKLLRLKNAIQTEGGKIEAQKRHEFMIVFLKQFFDEQNLDDWQQYLEKYLHHQL